MKKIVTSAGVFGPYVTVNVLEDRYSCDGADLPFSVVGDGNVQDASPDDFPPMPPPARPADEVQAEIVAATQARLDTFAKTRGYDGILSACTYATSPTAKFAAEGQYCVAQRDATWAKLYEMLAEVEAGTRPMPGRYEDVEAELPVLAWPA